MLTAFEAGNANRGVPDESVLSYANSASRAILTNNRRDFIRLHRQGLAHHAIVVFTYLGSMTAVAERIGAALTDPRAKGRFLVRVDGAGLRFDA